MKSKNSFLKIKNNDDNSITIHIPHGIYSKNTVLKACYKYLDSAYVKIESLKKKFVVEIKPKDQSEHADLFIDLIYNDLIDFELREIIAAQTKEIRDTLMARAFAD